MENLIFCAVSFLWSISLEKSINGDCSSISNISEASGISDRISDSGVDGSRSKKCGYESIVFFVEKQLSEVIKKLFKKFTKYIGKHLSWHLLSNKLQ